MLQVLKKEFHSGETATVMRSKINMICRFVGRGAENCFKKLAKTSDGNFVNISSRL